MVNACCSLPFVGKTLYILLLYVHARGKNILQRSSFRESMKLGCKKKSTISELSIPLFYVDYPIFSQLKYSLFMF